MLSVYAPIIQIQWSACFWWAPIIGYELIFQEMQYQITDKIPWFFQVDFFSISMIFPGLEEVVFIFQVSMIFPEAGNPVQFVMALGK